MRRYIARVLCVGDTEPQYVRGGSMEDVLLEIAEWDNREVMSIEFVEEVLKVLVFDKQVRVREYRGEDIATVLDLLTLLNPFIQDSITYQLNLVK